MTTTFAFALRPALPADTDFEHLLYASTRDDLRPLGPEVFDGLVGMHFRAQSMSIRLEHPQAERKIVMVQEAAVRPAHHRCLWQSHRSHRRRPASGVPQLRPRNQRAAQRSRPGRSPWSGHPLARRKAKPRRAVVRAAGICDLRRRRYVLRDVARLTCWLPGHDRQQRQFGLVTFESLQSIAIFEQCHQRAIAAGEDANPADTAQPFAGLLVGQPDGLIRS